MNLLRALLADKREDRFTEALRELLEDTQAAAAFVDFAGWPVIDGERWRARSQVRIEGGIVDLLLESDARTMIVEVKLGAELGENQPQNYAVYLESRAKSENRDVRLALLVPSSQTFYYREEVERRLCEAGHESLGRCFLTWEGLEGVLRRLTEHAGGEAQTYSRAFADLIEYHIGQEIRALTDSEARSIAHPDVIRAVRTALGLIDLIVGHLKRLLPGVEFHGRSQGSFWSGQNFTYKEGHYWIGFWVDAWVAHGGSPLWVQLPPGEAGQTDVENRYLVSGDQNPSVPLIISPRVSQDHQAELIAHRVASLVDSTTGLSGSERTQ